MDRPLYSVGLVLEARARANIYHLAGQAVDFVRYCIGEDNVILVHNDRVVRVVRGDTPDDVLRKWMAKG